MNCPFGVALLHSCFINFLCVFCFSFCLLTQVQCFALQALLLNARIGTLKLGQWGSSVLILMWIFNESVQADPRQWLCILPPLSSVLSLKAHRKTHTHTHTRTHTDTVEGLVILVCVDRLSESLAFQQTIGCCPRIVFFPNNSYFYTNGSCASASIMKHIKKLSLYAGMGSISNTCI